MEIDQITDWQAVAVVAGILAFAWFVLKVIPGFKADPRTDGFTDQEIRSYDRHVPKYFLMSALALLVGGVHTVIKNVPGFWQWLWEAGYGGHLFRDLSNSHIIIVGGGTVLLTGITWYVLPRITNRPLFSASLATASLWLTVIGVFGFYIAWLVLGLVEGQMIRGGMDYLAAKDLVDGWHSIPTGITAGIMGMGYWTYVANVLLTVWAARGIKQKPLGYLQKFVVVSSLGLFVGTVQGVIQVMPDNATWIRLAGGFGEFIDPISHAHINLVTGVMVSLSAFLLFFSTRLGGKFLGKRAANIIFWVLVPGSLAFYLTFLLLGLVLGGAANGYGGIQAPQLVQLLAAWKPFLLAVSGTLMLAGFWAYFITLWRNLGLRNLWEQVRQATPSGFWLVSSFALLVGTLHGLLQAIPATAALITGPEELPNVHAQLNMIGGVILALIGLVSMLLPELVGKRADPRLMRVSLAGIGGGIGAYYVATLVTGLLRGGLVAGGLSDGQAADRMGWIAPTILLLTALPMLVGYIAYGTALMQATHQYRVEWWARIRTAPTLYNGPAPRWRGHVPVSYFILAEVVGAAAGFPGLGWIMSGYPSVGLPIALIGPALAWGILPLLSSPFGDGPLVGFGAYAILLYLVVTAALSVGGLCFVLRKTGTQQAQTLQVGAAVRAVREGRGAMGEAPSTVSSRRLAPAQRRRRVRSLRVGLGAGVLLGSVAILPAVPWVMGIVTDAKHVYINAVPTDNKGTYLITNKGVMELFAWNEEPEVFPGDAPTLQTGDIRSIAVVQNQFDTYDKYQLYDMNTETQVTLQGATVQGHELAFNLGRPLTPGQYMMVVPSDSMYGGEIWNFFKIK